jgi:glycerol kinase
MLTRRKRFLAGRVVRFFPKMVNMRYLWVLQNVPEIAALAAEGVLLFGTIDTWLLWKLSKDGMELSHSPNDWYSY